MTSPQFARRTHSARDRLEAAGGRWQGIWPLVDQMREQGADWPLQSYLPAPAASGVLTAWKRRQGIARHPGGMMGDQSAEAAELACLAAWRMTQGIYRIDPALYAALIDTPLSGDVPADVLLRMPEWCCYIEHATELPSRSGPPVSARGLWAWLDTDERSPLGLQLAITWDVVISPAAGYSHVRLPTTYLPLVGSVLAAADEVARRWREARADGAAHDGPPSGQREAYGEVLPPALSLLLYLCSVGSDITGRKGSTPGNPTPVRTRRDGWRLFPAQGPQVWDVGVRMGAALRRAYQAEQTLDRPPTGATVRGHVRRAHWHGFRSGPRLRQDGSDVPTEQRRLDLRWLPPIPVNLADLDTLPAVVRPVK